MKLTDEHIADIIEQQLACWPLAKMNFDNLRQISRKPLQLGDFHVTAQLNPARIRSTGADVSKEAVSKRECFLCSANRPAEQMSAPWPSEGWELLINPYPILPVHFTIVSSRHEPQEEIPFDMAEMAESAPSLAIFFNGARAGASAPDHLHCQAVLKSELPIVRLVEECHPSSRKGWISSEEFGRDLPFHFLSAVITPDLEGMSALAKTAKAFGIDAETGLPDKGLVNAFFWIGSDSLLRIAVIPRRAHRPPHYFREEAERYVISPGALDMAGLLVIPRKEDFERIDTIVAREIYSAVAFPDKLPEEIRKTFIE